MFPDSMVRDVTPWQVREEAEFYPDAILPAYIGSGRIGVGIDASGMQGLDCRLSMTDRYKWAPGSHADDLYVFHERMISEHINLDPQMTFHAKDLMPLGYLDYTISIDNGPKIRSADLAQYVTRWERTTDIRQATVDTVLYLKQGIRLRIQAFSPYDSSQVCFRFFISGIDDKPHRVTLSPQLHPKLRPRSNSWPVTDTITHSSHGADTGMLRGIIHSDGKFKPLEDYEVAWGVAGKHGTVFTDAEAVGITFTDLAVDTSKTQVQDVIFYFGSSAIGTDDNKSVDAVLRSFLEDGFNSLLNTHKADYASYYDSGAQIHVGDAKREFMYNNSVYLLRLASSYRSGVPLNLLLFHPVCWSGATFWDLNFVLDGLIRSNHLEPVGRAVTWLKDAVNSEGRPFHWMIHYDGTSAWPSGWGPERGYLVSAAHAMSAIRHYETTRDRQLLASTIYPIVERVADYAVADRFITDPDNPDHYIGASSGNDGAAPTETNETFTTLWFAVVVKKAIEYSAALGVDNDRRAIWQDRLDGLKLEKGLHNGKTMYFQSRTHPRPGSWLSMSLYPTEASPLVDPDTYAANRSVQCFLDWYHSSDTPPQQTHQPWVYFWQAVSDMRLASSLSAAGIPSQWNADTCEAYIATGLSYIYGPGYFCEIAPESTKDLVGMPPYQSAHGAYITAASEQLVSGSIWEDTVDVFVNLPASMRDNEISFTNIRTPRGQVISATMNMDNIKITLSGRSSMVRVRVLIPSNLVGKDFTVTANGRPCETTVQDETVTFSLKILSGESTSIVLQAP